MNQLQKNPVLLLILGVLSIAIGIILLPPFGIGVTIIGYLCCVCLLAYLFAYLLPRMLRARGKVQVVMVVEFVALLLVAVGLLPFIGLQIFKLSGVCQILAFAIWFRGVSGLVRGYVTSTPEGKRAFPFWAFALQIGLTSVGAYFFAKPLFTDEQLSLIIAILFFILAVALIVLSAIGFQKKSKRKKSRSAKQG